MDGQSDQLLLSEAGSGRQRGGDKGNYRRPRASSGKQGRLGPGSLLSSQLALLCLTLSPPVFVLFYFFKTGFLGCFRTYSVEHTGLKLRDLPVTVSRMLVLQVCPTTTWSDLCNFILWVEVFCLHVYSCTMGMLSTHKDQRRISGPLEVELQEQFVTCLVSAWN